ncbi:hypothetical protein GLYMA_08G165000v4 [Glycine max]|nr:hypothetical protein GLYMA_08G165000v4 [Glycine max]
MAKQIYASILFIVLFFAQMSIQVATSKCIPENKNFLGPCTSNLVCLQICQTQGFDDGECNMTNLHCTCLKRCSVSKNVHLGEEEAPVKTSSMKE